MRPLWPPPSPSSARSSPASFSPPPEISRAPRPARWTRCAAALARASPRSGGPRTREHDRRTTPGCGDRRPCSGGGGRCGHRQDRRAGQPLPVLAGAAPRLAAGQHRGGHLHPEGRSRDALAHSLGGRGEGSPEPGQPFLAGTPPQPGPPAGADHSRPVRPTATGKRHRHPGGPALQRAGGDRRWPAERGGAPPDFVAPCPLPATRAWTSSPVCV